MRVLALDSSGIVASVAVVEDDTLVAEYTVNYKKTHSQTLLPMLDEIVKMTELDLKTIDAIVVAKGPGSFTGLRIGLASIKMMACIWDVPLIGVDTLEALAWNMAGGEAYALPIMDAQRGNVYAALYSVHGSEVIKGEQETVISIDELTEKSADSVFRLPRSAKRRISMLTS